MLHLQFMQMAWHVPALNPWQTTTGPLMLTIAFFQQNQAVYRPLWVLRLHAFALHSHPPVAIFMSCCRPPPACLPTMIDDHLIACHECDLLIKPPTLRPGATACCPRCGAVLFRKVRNGLERALAFAVTAVVLYLLANFFPVMALEINGTLVSCTLAGAAGALWAQGIQTLSILVLITTVIVPGLQLAIVLYLLIPLRLQRVPPYVAELLRALQALRPWSMIEVFMLGILVSISKLASMAQVIPGIALWSFALLMLMMTAVFSAFDARQIWRLLPERR